MISHRMAESPRNLIYPSFVLSPLLSSMASLSQQMDPEDLRPFNDQVHWVSSRTHHRPNSPVQAVCTGSRPAQVAVDHCRLFVHSLKPAWTHWAVGSNTCSSVEQMTDFASGILCLLTYLISDCTYGGHV